MVSKSPKPPDPADTTRAQAQANKEAVRESALVNQIQQVTPFGTETFTGEIGTPERTRTVSLTPTGQQTLDAQQRIALALAGFGEDQLGTVRQAFQNPLSFEGLTPIPGREDLLAGAQGLEQATFDRGRNLLQPQFDEQRRSLEVQLANQGIPRGSQAFNDAFDRLDRAQNEAFENLSLSAVGAGRQEQSRLAGLAQALRQQDISETLALRSQPINELAALLQGAPAIGTPSFQAPAQFGVQAPDAAGAILADFNARQAQANQSQANLFGGLSGLGSIALGGLF